MWFTWCQLSIYTGKRILLWTNFYSENAWDGEYCLDDASRWRQKEMCEYQCEFTRNRELLNSSHAVVFHGINLHLSLTLDTKSNLTSAQIMDAPPSRNIAQPAQPWIFFLIESPTYSMYNFSGYNNFNNFFNWTMTYRTDSDIYIPYGKIVKRDPLKPFKRPSPLQPKRGKGELVAWISSNCKIQPSKRSELVSKLQKYLRVDIYGVCGTLKCSIPNWNFCRDLLSCYKQIGKDYKFYLAFENSLCEDYVTEKAYHALSAGMVPVVYGNVNYSHYLPLNSFIDVRDFKEVKELAEYLLLLDKNETEFAKYFEWRRIYFVVEDQFYLERAWCSLCEKLSRQGDAPFPTRIVSNLYTWFNFRNGSIVCVLPPSNFSLSLKFQ